METSRLVFTALLPILFIIAAGFGARRVGWLNEEADRSLMALVVNLLYPALIFSFILGNDALREPANLILPPLVGLVTTVAGFGIAMLVARRFRVGTEKDCRTFAFSTGLYNYGYFPIPIAALLFDRDTMGVLLVFNVGVEVAMWALGVGFILSADDPKSVWRRVFSGPVIAILIAVPLNYSGASDYLPNSFFEGVDLLGRSAIPLGLLLIGATFADLAKGAKLFQRIRIPVLSISVRMGLMPVLFIALAALLPFPDELKNVIVVQAAMPCAVFPIVLARHFDGSPDVALRIVLSTTVISAITIPFWIAIGLGLI